MFISNIRTENRSVEEMTEDMVLNESYLLRIKINTMTTQNMDLPGILYHDEKLMIHLYLMNLEETHLTVENIRSLAFSVPNLYKDLTQEEVRLNMFHFGNLEQDMLPSSRHILHVLENTSTFESESNSSWTLVHCEDQHFFREICPLPFSEEHSVKGLWRVTDYDSEGQAQFSVYVLMIVRRRQKKHGGHHGRTSPQGSKLRGQREPQTEFDVKSNTPPVWKKPLRV